MKKIILLALICAPFFVSAQETDTNASIFSEVSEYRNYQEVYLSNLGQAKLHLTSPFALNNRDLRSLFPSVSNSESYTDVFYITGSGGENYVDVEHHQRLAKHLLGEAKILKSNSEGIYINQNAQLSDFRIKLNYKPSDKRYSFKANFNNYKRFALLNGGTPDSSFFALLDSNNGNLKSTFPTNFNNLPNSTNNLLDLKIMDISYGHSYDLKSAKNDSTSHLRLSQQFSYNRISRKIGLVNSSDFFDRYLYDSITTNDSLKLEQLSHRFGIDYVTEKMILSVGLGQNYYEYASRAPFETHLENLLFASASYTNNGLSINSYGEFMVSEIGYESFEIRNNLQYTNNEKEIFQEFELTANVLTDLPELYWNRYQGNHVEWNSINERNGITQLNFSAFNPTKKYGVSVNFENQTNAMVFDSTSTPVQASMSVLGFSLHKEFQFTKWLRLTSHVHIQDLISSQLIEVPNFLTYNKLHFTGKLIKKVLSFDAGINVLYYSRFTPRGYNPGVDEFFIQTNQTVGNYPIVDVFAEFFIKKNFAFFITITHVNSNLVTQANLQAINQNLSFPRNSFGKNYLATTQYPIQDRAFKAGLKWRLFD